MAATADAAKIHDCRSPCRERYGLDIPWLGNIWFVHECCGQACSVITWLLLVYAECVLMLIVVPEISFPYNVLNAVFYNFFAFLALASHIRATLTDPGAVEKGNATPELLEVLKYKEGEIIYRCTKCNSVKPPRSHHCSVCQRCIRKMDHHCPWVNNCIGEDNQKFFVLFTLYICVICCHAFALAFAHFLSCFSHPHPYWTGGHKLSPVATVMFIIFLLLEAIAFAIFTGTMLWTQLSSVLADETGIEQLKNEPARWDKKSRWLSLKSVFGHPFSWHWFSPFSSPRQSYIGAHLHTV